MAELREFRRTAKPRRPAADDGHALAGFLRGRFQHGDFFIEQVIGGIALQAADFYRVSLAVEHHARAFTQDFGRTNARAACAQDVR